MLVVGTTVFVVLCSIDAVAVQCMAFRYDSCYGSSRVGSGFLARIRPIHL